MEGMEAFAEKEIEYGEMMDDHAEDLKAVIQRQLVVVEGMERKAKLAEDRRVKEFQRALERMDPLEAIPSSEADGGRNCPYPSKIQYSSLAVMLTRLAVAVPNNSASEPLEAAVLTPPLRSIATSVHPLAPIS